MIVAHAVQRIIPAPAEFELVPERPFPLVPPTTIAIDSGRAEVRAVAEALAGYVRAQGLASIRDVVGWEAVAARWRSAHRLLPIFWLLAVLHGLLVGTDATKPWALAALALPLAAAALLVLTRVTTQQTAESARIRN